MLLVDLEGSRGEPCRAVCVLGACVFLHSRCPSETLQFFAGLRTDRFHGTELAISSIADYSEIGFRSRFDRGDGDRSGNIDCRESALDRVPDFERKAREILSDVDSDDLVINRQRGSACREFT